MASSTNGAGTRGYSQAKSNLDADLPYILHQNQLKIEVKWKIRFLQSNIGVNLHVLTYGEVFSDTKTKVQSMEEIDTLFFINIKIFCSAKECHENEKTSTDWEKISAKDTSHKGLFFKYTRST